MSRHLRLTLFLLPTLLLACEAPPMSAPPVSIPPPSAPPPAPVANASASAAPDKRDEQATPPKTPDDGDPNAAKKDDPATVAKVVEMFTQRMEKEWCTSPPKAGCDAIQAFAAGSIPDRPKGPTTTVGDVVTQTDKFMVLHLEPQGKELPRWAVEALRPDDAAEVAQTHAYINSIRQGKRDLHSPLHAFLKQLSWQERLTSPREVARGLLLSGPSGMAPSVALLRQKGRNLYLYTFYIGNAAGSFDLRPVEDLVVFPAP